MNVIGFDCFETVFNASGVPESEVREYVRQVRSHLWAPLRLPASWVELPAHADAAEGIKRLRSKFRVVTCSNLPLALLHTLSQQAGIQWDAIIPLEASRCFKPDRRAYRTVCHVLQVEPADVLIVSAHPDGPDAEGAPQAGMGLEIIRQPNCPQTITELAANLGC
jgi:2-haloacid dehalogenase